MESYIFEKDVGRWEKVVFGFVALFMVFALFCGQKVWFSGRYGWCVSIVPHWYNCVFWVCQSYKIWQCPGESKHHNDAHDPATATILTIRVFFVK